jgi:hypothetical protein
MTVCGHRGDWNFGHVHCSICRSYGSLLSPGGLLYFEQTFLVLTQLSIQGLRLALSELAIGATGKKFVSNFVHSAIEMCSVIVIQGECFYLSLRNLTLVCGHS